MGRPVEAIKSLRDGLLVNPLSAPLYYSLGLAERQQGNAASAENALALAEILGQRAALR
jgi:predicted Zn-dependent protease